MKKSQMILNTDAEIFSNWLRNRDRQSYMRSFPTNSGHIGLGGARIHVPQAGRVVVDLEGTYVSKSGVATKLGRVIGFELLPLSTDRLEVTAVCEQDVALPYFQQLLGDIEMRWPEVETRDPNPTFDDVEAAPALSVSRPTTVRKWKAAWRHIKPQIGRGKPFTEIAAWMENTGLSKNLPSSTDTIRKIAEAGEDGLLD